MGGMIPLADPHAMHGAMGSSVMPASVEERAIQDVEPRLWGGIGSPGGSEAGLLPVEVTALQFAFLFHYPEGDITSGELHVKAGQTVELRMEARDVIHAFWVPQFRLKQDVIPGQPTVLTFTPTLPGNYPIICAELCGPYHGGMRSTVVVHEPEAFDTWLASNSPATLALNPPLSTG